MYCVHRVLCVADMRTVNSDSSELVYLDKIQYKSSKIYTRHMFLNGSSTDDTPFLTIVCVATVPTS